MSGVVRRKRARVLFVAVSPVLAGAVAFGATPTFVGSNVGTISDPLIDEASGIAASRLNPNVVWVQNDSGNPAQVFALTPAGTKLETFTFSGAINTDWEDIDVGPGPTAGVPYLYVADIGDNGAANGRGRTDGVSIYRVPEPSVSDTQSPALSGTISSSSYERFNFVYPDGPRDAESMFVDPLTKDMYIISKTNPDTSDQTKHVYVAPYPQSSTGTTTLTLVTKLNNPTHLTAADISPDGSEIIIRGDATTTGEMFIRPAGGTVADALATAPITIPLLSDPQGEGIGFDPQGRGYFTSSEYNGGSSSPINYYNLVPGAPGAMYWDADGVTAGSRSATGAGTGGVGAWSSGGVRWYTGAADVVWANGNDAIFWGTAGTVTLSAAQTVNSLTFKTDGYVLNPQTAQILTLGGPSITVDAGVTATINSIVAGSVGLVKNGAGKLVLTSSSNQTSGYTGGTTINAGILNVSSGAIGMSGTGVTINNGATLQFTGSFTLAAARSVTLGSGGGVMDSNGNTDTVAGVISGSSLTKVGSGTLLLSAVNTYTGTTTVSVGTLSLNASMLSGSSVNVSSGATFAVIAGSAAVVRTGTVATAGTGKVDLADNKLIVTGMSVGAWNSVNSTYDGVTGLLKSGRGNGTWNGSGIVTSMTAATAANALTTLATAAAGDVGYGGTHTFGGQSVASNDILVMYTYVGDSNLNGAIDADDYFRIDNGFGSQLHGWVNGDFNYDGVVNADDYFLIDRSYSKQGMPFSSAPAFGAVAAVPEPGLLVIQAAGVTVLALRRRSRRP